MRTSLLLALAACGNPSTGPTTPLLISTDQTATAATTDDAACGDNVCDNICEAPKARAVLYLFVDPSGRPCTIDSGDGQTFIGDPACCPTGFDLVGTGHGGSAQNAVCLEQP